MNQNQTLMDYLAALEEREQAKGREWQDIGTAPKDGTEILGWNKDNGGVICDWVPDNYWGTEDKAHWHPITPNHWQPLPQPPKEG